MQELVIGHIDYFGRADEVLDGIKGKQTTVGKRNAVCRTTDGRRFHIRDHSWAKVRSFGLKVPQFKNRRGRHIGTFPALHEAVYALVDFSIEGACGANPDAIGWCAATKYEEGLKRILGQHRIMNQDAIVDEVRDIIDSAAVRTPANCSQELDALESVIMTKGKIPANPALVYARHQITLSFFRHFVLNVPSEEINNPAPS